MSQQTAPARSAPDEVASDDRKNPDNLDFTPNAVKVLQNRYLDRNEKGEFLESPRDMVTRVARTMADVELEDTGEAREFWFNKFFDIIASRRFMPNSPTLMNAGRYFGSLSACFVLPVDDDMNSILNSQRDLALIQRAGGGVGFAFDQLRPCGAFIRSSGGQSSGPIAFWRSYAETTNAIQQGAFRRGANMAMMYVTHPDILKFLFVKQDLGAFTNYNVSVKVTDKWMDKLAKNPSQPHVVYDHKGRAYLLPKKLLDTCRDAVVKAVSDSTKRSVVDTCYRISDLIPIEAPHNGDVPDTGGQEVLTVRDIWNVIVSHAHATGEPGLCFIDRIRETEPTPHTGLIEASNPCGEQYLQPNEACNLGSLNVAAYVQPLCLDVESLDLITDSDRDAAIDWEALREDIYTAVRFLDNVVDANKWPTEVIGRRCHDNRKVGLGVMGYADMLLKLGLPYGDIEGLRWGEKVMSFVHREAVKASEKLAEEKGVFPQWKGSRWDTQHGKPIRNSEVTTVAPTGTISIIADCSGGIEPLFCFAFDRNVLDGQKLLQGHPLFEQLAKQRGFYSEDMLARVKREGSIQGIAEIPDDVKRVFVTAHDVPVEWHIDTQAMAQRNVSNSVSKTVNLPHSATVDAVAKAYQRAYAGRCKGITVYRDGCRDNQPMALDNRQEKDSNRLEKHEPEDVPEVMSCLKIRRKTIFGTIHVKIAVDPVRDRDMEVFAQVGKGGDLLATDLEGLCRLISLHLRCGGDLWQIIDQLIGIGSVMHSVQKNDSKATSLSNELAVTLLKYVELKRNHGLENLLLGRVSLDVSARDSKPKVNPGNNGNGAKRKPSGPSPDLDMLRKQRSGNNDGYRLACPNCQEPDAMVVMVGKCPTCFSCGASNC